MRPEKKHQVVCRRTEIEEKQMLIRYPSQKYIFPNIVEANFEATEVLRLLNHHLLKSSGRSN
jgi:hypothetical protein